MDIELTERCNNNCIHCYNNLAADSPVRQRELTVDEIKAVLTEAALLGCMSITYTGGEPLLRNEFEELYVFAKKLGMLVTIRTNATLITPHMASVFARFPPGEPVLITVYGTSKSAYEAVTRTPGSFEAFLRGVGLLVEHGVPFELSVTITRLNTKELDNLKSWPQSLLGVSKKLSYSLVIDLSARRDEDRNAVLQRLRLSPDAVLRIKKDSIENYLKDTKAFCKTFMHPAGDALFSCGACTGSCAMDAYGNLQPCLQLRHPDTVYNIKNGSLKDAMTAFFPGLRAFRAENATYLDRCVRCFLHGLCRQCPAKSWMEYGTLDTPVEYLCELAHAEARDIGLLQAGETAWNVKDWKERINKQAEG